MAGKLQIILTQNLNYMKNKHAQALGKVGGKVTSDAKAKASRENGKKGGRPKRKIIEK